MYPDAALLLLNISLFFVNEFRFILLCQNSKINKRSIELDFNPWIDRIEICMHPLKFFSS